MWKNKPKLLIVRRAAFTLVELLLVVSLFGLISVSLYQSLSNGLRVWKQTRRLSVEEDIMIFFDKFAQDLRNGFNYSLCNFEEDSDRFAVTTFVQVPLGYRNSIDPALYADQIGRVEYGLDPLSKFIYRRTANYSQAVNGEYGKPQVLVKPVDKVAFRYFDRENQQLKPRKFHDDNIPAAVEAKVTFYDKAGKRRELKRLVNIPLNL